MSRIVHPSGCENDTFLNSMSNISSPANSSSAPSASSTSAATSPTLSNTS